ncbi:MAG: hypothetical protein M1839_004545 [Geoglossum umbratile]|nr:MAG: hypothetical protein M1839_004545 [Geoglossum umbratile]
MQLFGPLLVFYALTSSVFAGPLGPENTAELYARVADVGTLRSGNTAKLENSAPPAKHESSVPPPPTYDDILGFLRTSGLKYKSGLMVFWSGITVSESQDFAKSMGRLTMEMLIEGKWEDYKTVGPYWKTWEDAVNGFWIPASKAAANFAARDVLVYLSPEADTNKQPNACEKTFVKIERPALIDGLNNGRVSSITKYISPSTSPAGKIDAGYKDSCSICGTKNGPCNWSGCKGVNGLDGNAGYCTADGMKHATRTGALAETNSEARQEYALRETTSAAGAPASVATQMELATHTAVRGRMVDVPPGTIMAVLATPEHPRERDPGGT